MKRLLPLFGALVLAISPIAAELAHAEPGGRGRGRDRGGERFERRGGGEARGNRDWSRGRGPRWDREPSRGQAWREDRGDPRRYEDGSRRGPRAYGERRGAYIGGGVVVDDYSRHRLRAPPRGFVWMRMGPGYGLVSEDTGQVFDVIPY